jgi:hypothetical protein
MLSFLLGVYLSIELLGYWVTAKARELMERPGGGRGKEEFSLSFQPCWLGSDF